MDPLNSVPPTGIIDLSNGSRNTGHAAISQVPIPHAGQSEQGGFGEVQETSSECPFSYRDVYSKETVCSSPLSLLSFLGGLVERTTPLCFAK